MYPLYSQNKNELFEPCINLKCQCSKRCLSNVTLFFRKQSVSWCPSVWMASTQAGLFLLQPGLAFTNPHLMLGPFLSVTDNGSPPVIIVPLASVKSCRLLHSLLSRKAFSILCPRKMCEMNLILANYVTFDIFQTVKIIHVTSFHKQKWSVQGVNWGDSHYFLDQIL